MLTDILCTRLVTLGVSVEYIHTQVSIIVHEIPSIIIGASLSESHIDHDNSLHVWNTGIYLSCVCCTLVPEIRVCHEMLRVFQYSDMLTCVHALD